MGQQNKQKFLGYLIRNGNTCCDILHNIMLEPRKISYDYTKIMIHTSVFSIEIYRDNHIIELDFTLFDLS